MGEGSGRKDFKEVSFLFILYGGGKYGIHALPWIPIFDFYMIYGPTKYYT